ncbi:MAG TPA: histidinol dehydrogenase [Candidatus Methylomirabilis sp.]|nr:histidinol dehydrogenase [Candidatus Methylomirabilis sp.]
MRLLTAGSPEAMNFLARLRERARVPAADVEAVVSAILEDVRLRGDAALFEYTRKFDGIRLDGKTVRVPAAEIEAATASLEPAVHEALSLAVARIEAFHRRQHRESWFYEEEGVGLLGQLVRPLARVGLYVPGGSAAYPSTVLMNAIPARVAGVEDLVICTPPGRDGRVSASVLAAAQLLGIREIYRVGGAQAVAALAFGTESIRPADKIVGPGNIYVATAKRMVFGVVGIEMVAGPSEVLIVADERAVAPWIAADLLAQAEHDPLASALLVTPSVPLAEAVRADVERQLASLPRAGLAGEALDHFGAAILVPDLSAAVALANAVAPEHLELMVADPWALLPQVRNAGAVFLGAHTPEVAGDYLAGPNHVLPTAGTARFSSPLAVEDFQKRCSLLWLHPGTLHRWQEPIARLARLEGLEAHARSVTIRTKQP